MAGKIRKGSREGRQGGFGRIGRKDPERKPGRPARRLWKDWQERSEKEAGKAGKEALEGLAGKIRKGSREGRQGQFGKGQNRLYRKKKLDIQSGNGVTKHAENGAGVSGLRAVLGWSPSPAVTAAGALFLLFLLLLPLLRIAEYAVPWYDDLNYGRFAKAAMENTPGIRGALQGAAECVRTQWYAWQGTFSSIFFMALMPAIWGEEYYFLGPVFLILLLCVSVFVLTGVLLKDVLGADRASCLTVQAVISAAVIVLIHSSQAGFYWYNGGVHYVGMHSFGMLFLAALIHLLYAKTTAGRFFLFWGSVLGAVLTAGGNYVTALQGAVLLAFLFLIVCLRDRKKILWYLPVVLTYGEAFAQNAGAPGNRMRSAIYEGWGYPPLQAILRSFPEALKQLPEFTGWITPVILISLIPIIWRMTEKSRYTFRFPGLCLIASFCLYATGFTPSLYSLGHGGLSRTLNAVKITYQLLLFLNEIYWIGWLQRVQKRGWTLRAPWWFYGIMGCLMLFVFSQAPNQAGCYSSYGAYYYVHTGEAYNFHQEYLKRVEILKSDEKNVVFTPYRYKPWMICMGDLYEDPDREENLAVEAWYDKESVVVREDADSENADSENADSENADNGSAVREDAAGNTNAKLE